MAAIAASYTMSSLFYVDRVNVQLVSLIPLFRLLFLFLLSFVLLAKSDVVGLYKNLANKESCSALSFSSLNLVVCNKTKTKRFQWMYVKGCILLQAVPP